VRRGAALWSLPPVVPPEQRGPGRPRVYGTERVSLAQRAGQRRGWTTEAFTLYGNRVAKRYKTFLAAWKPAGGVIRVVLAAELASVAGLLPHRRVGHGRCDPEGRRRPLRAGDHLPRLQGGRRCWSATLQVRFIGESIRACHVCLWTCTFD
jgi:hypothetical protein